MPNIEIHGAGAVRAERMKKKIFSVLKDLADLQSITALRERFETVVVNICLGCVVDRHNQYQPFFRIFFEPEDNIEVFVNALRPFKVDIETVALERFVPRYDFNQNPDDRLERVAEPNYEET